jgi:hypothetical protein
VFEPFHPVAVPEARPFANRYVPADAEDSELARFLDRTLSGRLGELWPNYRVAPDRLRSLDQPRRLVGDYRKLLLGLLRRPRDRGRPPITKFIRANLMLGWIARRYQAQMVLLLRHPGAVAASKMRLPGAQWRHEGPLAAYLADSRLVSDHLDRVYDLLSAPLGPIAGHTALWCIENAIPLQSECAAGIRAVRYEHLLLGEEAEWKTALDALGLPHRPARSFLTKPSAQASREMRGRGFSAAHVARWRKGFSRHDFAEMQRILEAFGVAWRPSSPPTWKDWGGSWAAISHTGPGVDVNV